MSKDWLFHHIIDVLRSEAYRRPERDIYCPLWLAVFLGAWGSGFLITLLIGAWP